MKSLLFFDLITYVSSSGNISLLHGDVHVVTFDGLEHGLSLVPRVRLKLHVLLILLEADCLSALGRGSTRSHSRLEHTLIAFVLHDYALVTMTHFPFLGKG